MKKEKVLVTGGAGFIGSNLVDRLLKEDYDVIVIDNLSKGKKENLNSEAKFYEEDIRSKSIEKIFKDEKPDYVSHHAAQIDVRHSVEDPINDLDINGIGFLNIMENSKKYGIKKVISVSSGGVIYGESKILPIPESAEKKPLSPYGITKYLNELYSDYYRKVHNMNCIMLRYSNVYGPRQDSRGEAGVIDIFGRAMLRDEPCKIFGDGTQLRDYIYVSDITDANIAALRKGNNDSFNIATGIGTLVNQLFNILKHETNYSQNAVYLQERKGELKVNYLDISKAKHHLGWFPKVSLREGIKKTLDWIKSQ